MSNDTQPAQPANDDAPAADVAVVDTTAVEATDDTASTESVDTDTSNEELSTEDFDELVEWQAGLESFLASLEKFEENGLNAQGLHFAATTYNALRNRAGLESVSLENMTFGELKAGATETLAGVEKLLTVSTEGVTGALKGALSGAGAVIGGALLGGLPAAGVGMLLAGPVGAAVGGYLGATAGAVAGSAKLDIHFTKKRDALVREITRTGAKLAAARNKDYEAAKKAGADVPDKPMTTERAVGAAVKGLYIPFYTTYQGHKIEELEKQLREQTKQLANLLEGEVRSLKAEAAKSKS